MVVPRAEHFLQRIVIEPFVVLIEEDTIDGLPASLVLCGQDPVHDLELAGTRVHAGTGGAAPFVIDPETGRYRPSTLADLHDTASPEAVRAIAGLCHAISGSEVVFRKRLFLSLNINHVVPPLRFSEECATVLVEAVRHGIPAHVNTFGQLGASSPVTVAGYPAQTMAETLAGMVCAGACRSPGPGDLRAPAHGNGSEIRSDGRRQRRAGAADRHLGADGSLLRLAQFDHSRGNGQQARRPPGGVRAVPCRDPRGTGRHRQDTISSPRPAVCRPVSWRSRLQPA